MEKYIKILKQNSIKVTPQRLAMVSVMQKSGHISVNEIYESIKKSFPTLSLATVYKNINSMMESNFIKELKIVGLDAKYELVKEEHSHLICKKCGSVEDVFLNTDDIVRYVDKSGYEIEEVTVQLKGICRNCQ